MICAVRVSGHVVDRQSHHRALLRPGVLAARGTLDEVRAQAAKLEQA